MAHELEFQNGRASFFEVGEERSAWHREGILLTKAPTLMEALEVGRLAYEVVKEPTKVAQYDNGTRTSLLVDSAKAFVTRRTDTGRELGSVGRDYTPLQNIDAFASLIPLLDSGVAALETGGVLRDGEDAWLLAKFDLDKFGPVVKEVFAGEVLPFALFTNNHTGRRNATVALSPIRVVCANTLGMAEFEMDTGRAKNVSVRHTGDAAARLVEGSQELLGGMIERYERLATAFKLLKNFYLDEAMFGELVIEPSIGKHPIKRRNWNPEARMAETVIERWEKKAASISNLWVAGKGHTGDRSAWEAYNGVVEAIDHDNELFPVRGGVYRTANLLHGRLRAIKDTVLNRLVGAASGGTKTAEDWLGEVDGLATDLL